MHDFAYRVHKPALSRKTGASRCQHAKRKTPNGVTVWFRGIPYTLNLLQCRRALMKCQVDGDFDSMESLAHEVGISRSIASRFFSGRPTSLSVTLKILEALRRRFEDVASPVSDQPADKG